MMIREIIEGVVEAASYGLILGSALTLMGALNPVFIPAMAIMSAIALAPATINPVNHLERCWRKS